MNLTTMGGRRTQKGPSTGMRRTITNADESDSSPGTQGARRRQRVREPFGQLLLARACHLPALRTAIVEPLDASVLKGTVAAAQRGLIVPVLIGPPAALEALALAEGVDIASYKSVPTEAGAQAQAVSQAVALARAGEVDAIMKGSLRTDQLMHAIVAPEAGLAAPSGRRMSHIFVLDVPRYPRPLLLTDGALNILPDLLVKRDIVQNAIDLAHALGTPCPRVAVLSATEIVNPALRSSLDAAALSKMAERGQISGGIVDGPLAFDDAVSARAVATKCIHSRVAGRADILVVPDLDAGNMLAKQLEYFARARLAGIVVGGKVPIILTSRADDAQAHMISCALAQVFVAWRTASPEGPSCDVSA